MVLQRGVSIPVWGWSPPGETVTVEIAGQIKKSEADAEGNWMVRLDPMPATLQGKSWCMKVSGVSQLVFDDILIGEVWLCAGQSNMEFTVSGVRDAEREVAEADNPLIRQFAVPRQGAIDAKDGTFVAGAIWRVSSPATVGEFTAVGYFFAREISRALGGVPVGLFNASWGGTAIQSWMSQAALKKEPGRLETLLANKNKEIADWPRVEHELSKAIQAWETRAAAARVLHQPEPPNRPWNAGAPDLLQWGIGTLYNGMIHPLKPYAVRGALWYQGEANAHGVPGGIADYGRWQSDLIADWRETWSQGDFPFYFVQLPNWSRGDDGPQSEAIWAHFRAAQASSLVVPRTGMAIAIDVGDSRDIHPTWKQPVGRRLALLAEAGTYDLPVICRGPVYRTWKPINKNQVRISFDHAEGGLFSKAGPPRHFEMAGHDRRFLPAQAVVEGNEINLFCEAVGEAVAVRYAWADNPVGCNLYNHADLPAMPFRTDDW